VTNQRAKARLIRFWHRGIDARRLRRILATCRVPGLVDVLVGIVRPTRLLATSAVDSRPGSVRLGSR
jgi:hypothetical protein